jgi:glutathione S-transferase
MKLYQFPLSPNCQKVVALAHEVGLPLERVPVDVFKGGTRTPEFLARNPNGKIPVLEDGDFVLWESNAMLTYLAGKAGRTDLAPTAPRERANVERWLAWHNAHFAQAVGKVAFERIVKKLAGLGAPDEAVVAKGAEEFAVLANVLEKSLAGKEYLCGSLTIADFGVVTYAARTESCGLDFGDHPNVKAWLARMLARDSMRETLAAAREAA